MRGWLAGWLGVTLVDGIIVCRTILVCLQTVRSNLQPTILVDMN